MGNNILKFGIDFGTTNSSISIVKNGKAFVIPIDVAASDPRVIRSMLYFHRREIEYGDKVTSEQIEAQIFKEGEILYKGEQTYLVGQSAVNQYLEENRHRTSGITRKIFTGRWIRPQSGGGPAPDPVAEYYEEIDYGTGRLLQALKSSLKTAYEGTTIFGQFYSVEELIGIFIKEIKEKAEQQLGEKIDSVKVGRPVIFSVNREIDRKAESRLEQAVKSAGFLDVQFEYEPVAAARQYLSVSKKDLPQGNIILVFDFGGGTLDTALVKMSDTPQVLATDGVYIGGDLLNADIMQAKLWNYFGALSTWGDRQFQMPTHIYQSLNSWYSIPSLNNPETMELLSQLSYKNSESAALERLRYLITANVGFEIYEAIEKAKKELSYQDKSSIIFQDGPIDLNLTIKKDEFENIIFNRVTEIRQVVFRTLRTANIKPEQVDIVVRTGGSSLIPVFENMLIDIFGKEKITLFETFTSIAAGLALDR